VPSTAYLVLAHTDVEQCARLTRALVADSDAHIFLHVDGKSKLDFSGVASIEPARVHWVAKRYTVTWGGFNMVRATLAAIEQALRAPVGFDYLVLLSGMDYPIRHPQAIGDFLRSQPYRQHINRVDVRASPEHYLKVASHYDFRDAWLPFPFLDKVLRKACTMAVRPLKRSLPAGMVCTGSSWWAMTSECARYVLEVARTEPDYQRFFRFVLASDEYYFHTIIQNSPFAAEAVPLTPYRGRGMWRTANLHVIDPSLARTYTLADFDEVMASGKSFVRKVTSAASGPLLDEIDRKLGLKAAPIRSTPHA
jgi:hypothetical protein